MSPRHYTTLESQTARAQVHAARRPCVRACVRGGAGCEVQSARCGVRGACSNVWRARGHIYTMYVRGRERERRDGEAGAGAPRRKGGSGRKEKRETSGRGVARFAGTTGSALGEGGVSSGGGRGRGGRGKGCGARGRQTRGRPRATAHARPEQWGRESSP
ncbi:hypothetical protein BD413DRAFT_240112 [Trametes elegans]|nr:hypothetical protein BD413DRAFT_240112 [Trametes elegans]